MPPRYRHTTAVDWFRDAINADPRGVDYRLELVIKGYRPLLNWQLARQEALRSTQIEPDNQHAWRILGDVEMALCDVKRAAKAYDKQLEIAPDDPNAMLDRCVISLDVADYEFTEKLARKVMLTDRKADGIHVLAMIANRQGRHEDAIELFDQAIEADAITSIPLIGTRAYRCIPSVACARAGSSTNTAAMN